MGLEITSTRGTVEHYGPRTTDEKFGGRVSWNDLKSTAIWDFSYDDLPDAAAHNLNHVIPANSTIVSARVRIIDAFTSTSTTTDLTVGLQQSDGTEIDNDGLLTAAHLSQATIAVAGALYDGSTGTAGALVGFTIGAADGELSVASSAADLLTGRAQVIVEYLIPDAAAA
jgi:hypothetical protein